MTWYPFDTQRSSIVFVVDASSEAFLNVEIDKLNFLGRRELTQYFVKNFEIKKDKVKTKDAVIVSITLGRRLLGTFLTIFFPTILLNIIGYSTNYFKAFFFEVRNYFFGF